jgi:hypothetical protein
MIKVALIIPRIRTKCQQVLIDVRLTDFTCGRGTFSPKSQGVQKEFNFPIFFWLQLRYQILQNIFIVAIAVLLDNAVYDLTLLSPDFCSPWSSCCQGLCYAYS